MKNHEYWVKEVSKALGYDVENTKVCDHCNGYGSSLKEENAKCTKCGGSGLVKEEK